MGRRIVLLGPLPPPYGGVSVYFGALVEHLRGAGVRVWALLGDGRAREGVRFVRHRRFAIVAALLAEGRGARVLDASHFHLEHPNKFLLPIWLAAKRALRFEWYKNVLDGTLPARQREFGPLRQFLFRRAVASVDEFVVVSEELRRWLKEEIGVTQKVTVIACLLNIPRATLEVPLSEDVGERLTAYLGQARRVCSVGVFIHEYGFAQVAEAVERLRAETGEEIGLALLDGAFARDDAYREEVLRGREEWIAVVENVPNPQVYQVLRRSDCFVRAVAREGYGISRVEAAWCGTPVVATNVGETRGMLTYEFGDVGALCERLRRALYDPPREEVARWAETFTREADENLRAIKDVLGLRG